MKLSLEQQPVAGSENSSGPEESQTPSPLGEPCSQTQAQEAAPRSPGCNTDLEAKQRPNSSSVTWASQFAGLGLHQPLICEMGDSKTRFPGCGLGSAEDPGQGRAGNRGTSSGSRM